MKRKERRLARLVLGALLASGAMFAPGVVSAANVATNTEINDATDDTLVVSASSIALTIASNGKIKSIRTEGGYTGNTITVQGTITGSGFVSPYAITGGTTGTKVYIQDGAAVTGYIRAGNSASTDVTGNLLDISGGAVTGDVYGGYAEDNAHGGNHAANDNTVNVIGGTISGSVIGGYSLNGNATDNIVNIKGGTINGNVYGARQRQALQTTLSMSTLSRTLRAAFTQDRLDIMILKLQHGLKARLPATLSTSSAQSIFPAIWTATARKPSISRPRTTR